MLEPDDSNATCQLRSGTPYHLCRRQCHPLREKPTEAAFRTKKLALKGRLLYSTAIRVDTLGGNVEWSCPTLFNK
ncbi:hypothetical protein DKP76_13730 [Falsochrobactrum shanghaiense]|uniref:Uncharacterized protein n=1 Tax=Falsochrobactrum shanghaiense TaxID=2201899 RepID=A0A316J5F8_9HYPH|nr:hypothetical protein DKP76_13730 [Falsochrobactrum shanghaiense]